MEEVRTRITRGSGNVFLDSGLSPHQVLMLLRCEIAEALRKWMVL